VRGQRGSRPKRRETARKKIRRVTVHSLGEPVSKTNDEDAKALAEFGI